MKQGIFTVEENRRIARGIQEMRLRGDVSGITAPGQFVDIRIPEFFLRRPISVCDRDQENGHLTLVYKIAGEGTKALAEHRAGQTLDLLTGLGNGYDLAPAGRRPLLVGGGVGVPPMFLLCRELVKIGASPIVILGFNTKEELFYEEAFRELGAEVIVTTADGSAGMKGFVTDAIARLTEGRLSEQEVPYTYFYTCGPEPMLRAVCESTTADGQCSFEERMGCGFGACMGCSCRTKYGTKRICKDGPVLRKEEILW